MVFKKKNKIVDSSKIKVDISSDKDLKAKEKLRARRQKIEDYLRVAGYSFGYDEILKYFAVTAATATVIVSFYFMFRWQSFTKGYIELFKDYFGVALISFPLILLAIFILFYIYSDLRVGARRNSIEKVLAEFLHLTAANIRAGMPADQALWSAARPKFGALASEMEIVAKTNMVGEDLSTALLLFSSKYDSKILTRTISLIVEGIAAGSEIGDLLENIALSIEDLQTRKDSMAANVTSNVIFIMFSVLVAAPLLFAVSIQLLRVIHSMGGSFSAGDVGAGLGVSITLSTTAVQELDFFIFCIVSLILGSIMSNIIISTIKTGRPNEAVRKIPLTALVSIIIFLVSSWGLGVVFSGIFA